jgi:hypothetical protein
MVGRSPDLFNRPVKEGLMTDIARVAPSDLAGRWGKSNGNTVMLSVAAVAIGLVVAVAAVLASAGIDPSDVVSMTAFPL